MKQPKKIEECKYYSKCNAPLCPLDMEVVIEDEIIWHPDEEICRLKVFSKLPWVQAQKKIAAKGCRPDRYFCLDMLNRGCVIGKRMCGLDPDEPEDPQLKAWYAEHPPISEKKKLASAENIRKGSLEKAA